MSNWTWEAARDLLLEHAFPCKTERISLERCGGRVLAEEVRALSDVPPFDRSPYDGYAIRSGDTEGISRENPVTLTILEEVPAGAVCHFEVTPGTAVKVLTGSPIPTGADAVVPFEDTEFTPETVTLFEPVRAGSNVVLAGEDVKKGTVLAEAGTRIDAGLMGTLASQNMAKPLVYERPLVGLVSTGSELQEPGTALAPGKIYNSNRYTLTAALEEMGCRVQFLGTAGDDTDRIAALFDQGVRECDCVISTGGVSVGDYDLTPAAMEKLGAEILVKGVSIKPGMACCFARLSGKLLLGLSGNPASSMTNFYAVVAPALRKMCGLSQVMPGRIRVKLAEPFKKRSGCVRFLRGRLDLADGEARMHLPGDQGNVVLSSLIGCDVMAVVPAGSGAQAAGTELEGYLL